MKEIVPGGAAARDGRLSTGDQILAIGSSSLVGCAQSDAVGTIAKQSRDDAGVQLTVARGAAKHHRILDLIRPTDGSQTVPKASHTSNDSNTKSKHSIQPPASFADLHQSEVRRRPEKNDINCFVLLNDSKLLSNSTMYLAFVIVNCNSSCHRR